MTTEALKSPSVTNLDASPVVENQAGKGASGLLRSISDYVTVSASMAAGSTYRLVRVPSNCYPKHLFFESEAQGAGKFNLSVYYETNVLAGVIIPTTGDQFFASDIDCASAVKGLDEINESGNCTVALRQKQLWDALGLTSDPQCNFDIVAVVHTTDVTTGTGKLGVDFQFVM